MAQWYEQNRQLFEEEISFMAKAVPTAKYGFMQNGNMYWIIEICPFICGKRKNWTVLAVYDSDHPQRNRGETIKFYPIKPNYDEMMEMVQSSSVMPKTIPHLMRDDNYNIHISYIHSPRTIIINATTALTHIIRWITTFEMGLLDQKIWNDFCGF